MESFYARLDHFFVQDSAIQRLRPAEQIEKNEAQLDDPEDSFSVTKHIRGGFSQLGNTYKVRAVEKSTSWSRFMLD